MELGKTPGTCRVRDSTAKCFDYKALSTRSGDGWLASTTKRKAFPVDCDAEILLRVALQFVVILKVR